jgi:putative integral membrane protein (TIGR02587 family)
LQPPTSIITREEGVTSVRRVEPAGDGAEREEGRERRFAVGLARAFGGATIFALPMLMTMEMWYLGFYMERGRLALLLVLQFPLLVGLSYLSGFEPTFELVEDAVDACVALAVGYASAVVVLTLFGAVAPGMSLDEVVGKIALQAVPASIGALLAQSTFGGHTDGERGESGEDGRRERRHGGSYWWELFLMAVGALFLAFNVAPTEEMILIGYMMHPWQVVALAGLSLAAMHAFVYAVGFHGQESLPAGQSAWSAFARLTLVGYGLALAVSAYVLWTFGRFDGSAAGPMVVTTVVLAFPAAIGAAAARLIL